MRKLFFIFSFLQFTAFGYAQQKDLFSQLQLDVKNKRMIIVGEQHHISELHDIQNKLIAHVLLQHQEITNMLILVEDGAYTEYYLDKLMTENDSIGFYNFLLHHTNMKYDTMPSSNIAFYKRIMDLYYLSKSLEDRHLQFKCFDATHCLRPLLYTISEILKKYTEHNEQFAAHIIFLDSLRNLDHRLYEFAIFHEHFGCYFADHEEMFKEILTEKEFYYIAKMIKYAPTFLNPGISHEQIITQQREHIIFEEIKQCYNDRIFSFCIIGVSHIRGHFLLLNQNLINNQEEIVNVRSMLEKEFSNFKKETIVIDAHVLFKTQIMKNLKGEFFSCKFPYPYPTIYMPYRDELNNQLVGNVGIIDLQQKKFKKVRKHADYLIIVREGTSTRL